MTARTSVSAIVPTCDRPILLARALRSIAAQEVPPMDVVIVDDGSAPDSRLEEIAESCGLRDAVVVRNRRAKGASGARNTGAALARGEFLAFLDDDDEWAPTYLKTAVARVEARGLDLVCADLVYSYEPGDERPGKPAPDRLEPDLFLVRNPGLVGSNFVVRASLYERVGGFDESLLTMNDVDFGLRVSLCDGVRYEPLRERLVRMHFHAGPKLSTPRTEPKEIGTRTFFATHAHRMTEAQRAEFRYRAQLIWGVDELQG
jgi:glycosyltransferase involved in cell wall biosynthesis